MAANSSTVPVEGSTKSTQLEGAQILTGKQEHCMCYNHLFKSRQLTDVLQISNASSYPSRSTSKLQSSTPPPPCKDSALRSSPNSVKSPLLIQTYRSCDISSCTMSASSHSWIRQRRRSSGRRSCKWCVTMLSKIVKQHADSGSVQFLESFAKKHISSSEDRLEETKRKKLSLKCQKLVELMMVSGIPTASGYEERIRFSDLEVVDSGAIDLGVLSTLPEGHYMNGWDVNVAGVRTVLVKRNIRYHKHAVSQCDPLAWQWF